MKRISTLILASVTLLLTTFLHQKISAQTTVTLPGNFESELGCAGDWVPDCDATRLTQTGSSTWEGTFLIPAGNWEYKIAYDNSWAENYGMFGIRGGDNIPLSLASNSLLHFSFSTITHLVEVTPAGPPGGPFAVVLAGSFQNELGCSGDWQPDCKASGLSYDYSSNLWYGIFAIPPGTYEFKVTIENSWAENYGQGGVKDGPNIPLNVSGDHKILFRYNHETHLVTMSVISYNVILAGSFQSEMGCAGDWQADCPMTGLAFDAPNNLWKNSMHLPAGNWEFKVTIDGSWAENYGEGGVPGGPNIPLNLAEPSIVSFIYNPETHIVTYTVKPDIVVLPGNFQTELGCASDWDPACDNTKLTYDVSTNVWTGTFEIPACNWEFKVAHDHSWNENYGLYGQKNGPNIPLSLEMASTIQFNYDPTWHYVTLVYKKTGFCVTAFYDGNGNGYKDWDENTVINGASFSLSGNPSVVQTTDSTGKTCFSGLPAGEYVVKVNMPARYFSSSGDSQTLYLSQPQTLYFGAVCLGGAGAQNVSFWMNKKGKALFDSLPSWQQDYLLSMLRYFSLVDVNGNDFDPQSYDELAKWMQQSNAKNTAYKLSTQLAAMFMNSEVLMLGNRAIYTPGMNYWGLQRNFMNVYTVVWFINQQLMSATSVTGGDVERKNFEDMVKMLDHANSDLTFVQPTPCNNNSVTLTNREIGNNNLEKSGDAVVWPNPSGSYFNLRPSNNDGNVEIRVMDAQGKLVFSANGNASKIYRFGDRFVPGLYFVEIVQNGKHSTMKVLKQ